MNGYVISSNQQPSVQSELSVSSLLNEFDSIISEEDQDVGSPSPSSLPPISTMADDDDDEQRSACLNLGSKHRPVRQLDQDLDKDVPTRHSGNGQDAFNNIKSGGSINFQQPRRTTYQNQDHILSTRRSSDTDGVGAALSSISNNSMRRHSAPPPKTNVALRSKHQPHHRCSSMNESLTSICKPSLRYSSSQNSSVQESATSSSSSSSSSKHRHAFQRQMSRKKNFSPLKFYDRLKSLTTKNNNDNRSSSSITGSSGPSLNKYEDNLQCHKDNALDISTTSTPSTAASNNQSWVPMGVNFSANMEVYVYCI